MNSCKIVILFIIKLSLVRDSFSAKGLDLGANIAALRSSLNAGAFEDIPPYSGNEVACSVFVNNITAVEEKTQTFSLDVFLTVEWDDPRLANSNVTEEFTIPDRFYPKVWLPDVGFANGRDGHIHTVTQPNINVLLGPRGNVQMTTRVAVTLSCFMDFHNYPMDIQACELQLQSWRYSKNQLHLKWSDEAFGIQEGASVSLPQYNVSVTITSKDDQSSCVQVYEGHELGSYSCLELVFVFKRKLKFYTWDIYVPTILIVLISFMAPFIDYNIVPARVGIGSLSVSATVNMIRLLRVNTPPVSYVKASDVWIWACQIFVFAVFLEFGLVNVVNRVSSFDKEKASKKSFFKRSHPAKVVDKVSRIIFPCSFLLFNIIYWSYYLSVSRYYDKEIVSYILDNKQYN